LENKLDKAMIKYNEAQSIRKTYEQIVKRLKEERIGFDNQLQAIERTLQTKQKDYDELLLLSGDANHAKEVALNELDRVRTGYHEERKSREKELRESHQMVQVRRQMLENEAKREDEEFIEWQWGRDGRHWL
jgi:coiled-coil domain-containing protein 151